MSLSSLYLYFVNTQNMFRTPNNKTTKNHDISTSQPPHYLFKYLLFANMCLYLEAGAVPAMLIQISDSFDMTSGQQGLLGGIAYLSLGLGSPFAGFLLRHYEHKYVLGCVIFMNSIFTLIWALTPVNQWYSLPMFVSVRFVMGLMQCVVCIYLPLWTNEFAPKQSRARWMGTLQASVPFGVMGGYIIAASMIGYSLRNNMNTYLGLLCWRWPILVEWMMFAPFVIAFIFVPSDHLNVKTHDGKITTVEKKISIELASVTKNNVDDSGCSKDIICSDTIISPVSDIENVDIHLVAPSPVLQECALGGNYNYGFDINTNRRYDFITPPKHNALPHSLGIRTDGLRGYSNQSLPEIRSEDISQRRYEHNDYNTHRNRRDSWSGPRQKSIAASMYSSASALDIMRKSNDNLAALDLKEYGTLGSGIKWRSASGSSLSSSASEDKSEDEYQSINISSSVERSDEKKFAPARVLVNIEKTNENTGLLKNTNDSNIPDNVKYESLSDIRHTQKSSEELFDTSPIMPQRFRLYSDDDSLAGFEAGKDMLLDGDTSHSQSTPPTAWSSIMYLSQNSVYTCLLLSLTSLYFVVTGIQFWGASYMLVALNVSRIYVDTMFVFCASTAPTLGVFFGAWIVDKLGGYHGLSQRVFTLKLCLTNCVLACMCATFAAFADNFVYFVISLWLILFLGGSVLPACSGMLVSIVPRRHRPTSSSLSVFFFNMFGYFFSVFLSGYFMDVISIYYPSCDLVCSRVFGMRFVLLWSYWSLFFLVMALRYAYNSNKSVSTSP